MRVKIHDILFVVILAVTGFFALSRISSLNFPTRAYETECPESMTDDEECLSFLQEQARLIEQEKGALEGSINAENFEQMTLYQQISYIAGLVQEAELKIAEMQIEIETKHVEISLLGKEIIHTQNIIDTFTQEINTLETTIKKRTKSSYKMTFMSPVEIVLEAENFTSLLRRMKYVFEAKKQDRKLLAEMFISKERLAGEQQILTEKRKEVQIKQNEIESERAQLAEERTNLENQQAHQQALLAESQRREAEYQANITYLNSLENSVTSQITHLIMEMYQSGQLPANTEVTKGQVIGFQGHTGYAKGSHLHFELHSDGYNVNPLSYLSGGAYIHAPVNSGLIDTPLASAILTQDFNSSHYAIDLMSSQHGIQPQDWYHVAAGEVCCPAYGLSCIPEGWYSMRGEGAPVYAVEDGMITNVLIDKCGGKYTLIDHGVKHGVHMVTMYLHLR